MADCTKCANRNNDYCIFACENGESFKPITNADRIRSMTDEELAVILAMPGVVSPPWCTANDVCPYIDQDPARCDLCALGWLREEAET